MFKEFVASVIAPTSLKVILTEQAMQEVAKQPGVMLVHSPVLYRLYTLFAAAQIGVEDRPVFFRKVGAYLYYERFTCRHGEEFYYYIKFNEASPFYKEHKELIDRLVVASDPTTLTDYVGTKDLTVYNRALKERY